MNGSELKSAIISAKNVQSHRDRTFAESLKREIEKVENLVQTIMEVSYNEVGDTTPIPQKLVDAVEYLTSCHGLWRSLLHNNDLSLPIEAGFFYHIRISKQFLFSKAG